MNIALFEKNAMFLCICILIYTSIVVMLQNKILLSVLAVDKNQMKRTLIIQIIFVSLLKMALPMPYAVIAEVLIQSIIYKSVLKLKFEKFIILEEINLIMSAFTNLICAKIIQVERYSQISSNNVLIFVYLIAIFIYITLYIFLKTFKTKITMPECLNKKAKKQIIEVSIVSSTLILICEISLLSMIRILPSSIYFLAIILILSYYIVTIVSVNKTMQIATEQNKVNELEGNNTRLKESYEDICSFRHDMKNIMQGLGGYIAAKDMDGLTNMYNEFICDCKGLRSTQEFEMLNKLNPAIYNLINSKYIEAKKENINIKIEIYTNIKSIRIKTYELCRVLGILIDNAIEATRQCEDKQISIKFIKDNYNNRNLIIIENPCKNELIDLKDLNKKG